MIMIYALVKNITRYKISANSIEKWLRYGKKHWDTKEATLKIEHPLFISAQNRPKEKFNSANWIWGTSFMKLYSEEIDLAKQNHLLKIGFVIFLKGAMFSDFIDYRLLKCIPSGIQIHFPPFWRIFFSIRFKPHQVVYLYLNNELFSSSKLYYKICNSFSTVPWCFNFKELEHWQIKKARYFE